MAHCEAAEICLNSRSNEELIEIVKDRNGIDQVVLRNTRGATAQISLYGSQVLSWKNEYGEELLFKSSKATYKPPLVVRGGIPVCFPQYGSKGQLGQHGFVRNRMWAIDYEPPSPRGNGSNGPSSVNLVLASSEDDFKLWQNKFEIRMAISISEDGHLTLRSRVRNANGKPISFSFALRTYFSVSDISEVRVEGLETLDYLDNLCDRERFTEQGNALTFESEIDRIYLSSSDVVEIFDYESKRTFQIRKQGLPDVAIWNPWEKKGKAMGDMGDEEYKEMICVDVAAIEKPITLKPGEEWAAQLDLWALSSC